MYRSLGLGLGFRVESNPDTSCYSWCENRTRIGGRDYYGSVVGD